jgi:hypothetical protein
MLISGVDAVGFVPSASTRLPRCGSSIPVLVEASLEIRCKFIYKRDV